MTFTGSAVEFVNGGHLGTLCLQTLVHICQWMSCLQYTSSLVHAHTMILILNIPEEVKSQLSGQLFLFLFLRSVGH